MSLNKKKMVREIGRRTRLKNRDVQAVIETLVDVWTEELEAGGRIEIENFVTMTSDPATARVMVRIGLLLRDRLRDRSGIIPNIG